jgi:predicted permease
MTPPRLARWLLRIATPRTDREFLLADAAEEFERIALEAGRATAIRWYWGQALASLRPLGRERAEKRFRRVRTTRPSVTSLLADLSQAARFLRRHPAISVTVVMTLAIAFSVTLAAYSIVHAIMLSPLPFQSSDRIVGIRVTGPTIARGVRSSSRPDFEDWRERSTAFAALAAFTTQEYRLTERGEPREVEAIRVTSDLHAVFGLAPALGRMFQNSDFHTRSHPVAIITHAFWVSEFGKSASVLGQTLRLDDRAVEIVGVLPEIGMQTPPGRHVIWLPLIPREGVFWESARGTGWLTVIGRIRDDVSLKQADADLSAVATNLAREYQDTNRGKTDAELTPIRDELIGPVAPMLQLLAAALGAVLVIGCANIGSLLAASAANRSREFAVRSAIGAGRLHLARQIGAETLLLSLAAAGVAFAVYPLLVRAFLALYPDPLPRAVPTTTSIGMLAPSLGLALSAMVLLLFPQLLRLSRLKSSGELTGTRTISSCTTSIPVTALRACWSSTSARRHRSHPPRPHCFSMTRSCSPFESSPVLLRRAPR